MTPLSHFFWDELSHFSKSPSKTGLKFIFGMAEINGGLFFFAIASAGRSSFSRGARLWARPLGQTVVPSSRRLPRVDNRPCSADRASARTSGCVRDASYGCETKLPLARRSARPRGRSGWRARIARPALRRLPLRRALNGPEKRQAIRQPAASTSAESLAASKARIKKVG